MEDGGLVLLTGATGFIGSRLARRLAAAGNRLRCVVRPSSDTADLERLGAEIAVCGITDVAGLTRELAGVDLAYHVAGAYDIGVVAEAAMERVNVGGTRAFVDAVEGAGTARAVYVSTTAALGPVPEGEGDESTEYRGPYYSAYHRTKAEAHRLAQDAQRRGVPLVIVLPALVYGPGDRSPSGRFLADLLAGRLPMLLSEHPWYSYVHVDDVVEALVLAGERGRGGESYVVSGEHCRVDEFARRATALAGRRPPRLRVPAGLVRALGAVLDPISRLTGIRFPVSRELVDMAAGHRWLHSHAKASREFGWRPRPLAEGLPEAVAWSKGGGKA